MTEIPTRALLACGVAATPLFFTVAFAQIAAHDDFDLGRHMISQLSAGTHGWIQIADFVVTGALFVLAAAGFRRTVTEGPGRVWAPRLLTVFGAGLIAAGVFVADPAAGYPATEGGTTWHGILHGVAAVVSGLGLFAAALVLARRMAARKRTGLAVLSVVTGLVYMALASVAGQGGWFLAIGSIIGWGAVSVIAARLMARRSRPTPAATPELQHA